MDPGQIQYAVNCLHNQFLMPLSLVGYSRAADEQVRDRQVRNEAVRHGLHILRSEHHVDDQRVAGYGDGKNEKIEKAKGYACQQEISDCLKRFCKPQRALSHKTETDSLPKKI